MTTYDNTTLQCLVFLGLFWISRSHKMMPIGTTGHIECRKRVLQNEGPLLGTKLGAYLIISWSDTVIRMMDSDSNQQRSWMQSMLRGVNRHQDIKKPQPKPIFRQKLTSIFLKKKIKNRKLEIERFSFLSKSDVYICVFQNPKDLGWYIFFNLWNFFWTSRALCAVMNSMRCACANRILTA